MAHDNQSTALDTAKDAIASVDGIPVAVIADYLMVSFNKDGTVMVHTSLCCAKHALWLAGSVQFTDDECEILTT